MRYRVYLLDEYNKIAAAEAFIAQDDAEALEMATVLLRSTHDVFHDYEVWCGPQRVRTATNQPPADDRSLIDLAEERQIRMLTLEEQLLASFACIRRSRALLEATTELLEGRQAQLGHGKSE